MPDNKRIPLLMIPGTLCDDLLFEHQVSGLKNLTDCRVVSNSSSDNLREVASHILNDNKGNIALMGISYGGIIAFEILRQAPERVKRLILMDTTYKTPSQATKAIQERFIGMSYLGNFESITRDFLKESMLHPKQLNNIELKKKVAQMAYNVGAEAFFRQVKAQLGRPDSTPDLPNISCPTLVIAGKQDKVCPPEIHKKMTELIPNAQLSIIEECGHLSTMEQPETVNQVIIKWWKSIDKK